MTNDQASKISKHLIKIDARLDDADIQFSDINNRLDEVIARMDEMSVRMDKMLSYMIKRFAQLEEKIDQKADASQVSDIYSVLDSTMKETGIARDEVTFTGNIQNRLRDRVSEMEARLGEKIDTSESIEVKIARVNKWAADVNKRFNKKMPAL